MDKLGKRALGLAALLGSGLAIVWMFAIGYHAAGWLSWTVLGCGVIALAGLGPAAMVEMPGVGTWPLVGVVLLAAWLFALAVGATPWLAWLSFAFGLAFVILSVAFTAASSNLAMVHHRRHLHQAA
jgi:hypothetical protein